MAEPTADDATAAAPSAATGRPRRRGGDLAAARECLLADGYAALSTRRVADIAEVPLSQIHYHFGSKRQLILAVLAAENERLLERQREMFDEPEPLWVRWDRACDFLEADLDSGYVRILQEMIAAGWSDAEVAALGARHDRRLVPAARRGRPDANRSAAPTSARSRRTRSRRSWRRRSSAPRS